MAVCITLSRGFRCRQIGAKRRLTAAGSPEGGGAVKHSWAASREQSLSNIFFVHRDSSNFLGSRAHHGRAVT